MPENGFYFDNIMRQKEEVDEDNLDYHDNIEEYGPVSDAQQKFFADACCGALCYDPAAR